MKETEVFEIITMIDSMNRGRDSFVPALVRDGKLESLGPIWAQELADLDAEIAMEAVIALYTSSTSFEKPRPVTPKDLTDMVKRIERERRQALPALPEAEYERKTPRWVRGKLLAIAKGDGRVWPEQKAGYNALQNSYPAHRTYIWGDQEMITDDQREIYIEEAMRLTADEFESVYDEVFGNKS